MKLYLTAALTLSLLCVNAYAAESSQVTNQGKSKVMTSNHIMSPAEKNKQAGIAFLAENKKKPGVITLPDGLQYKIITEGKGNKPSDQDTVTVNYSGKLIDGTVFDSSYTRGQPASFPVNGVIPGWTEALKLMPVGSTWELYIPANLAYGEMGAGSAIGPNQTLIFTVNLISIDK